MTPLQWSSDLEIGILWQDHQHRRFFKIRDLLTRSSEAEDMKLFAQALMQLEHYVEDHFSTEEAYMSKRGYPQEKEHLAEHKTFVQMLKRAKKEFLLYRRALTEGDHSGLNPWLDLSLDLELWFVEHIKGSDRLLGNFLKEKTQS
ncbi:MAG: hemerythrin domain-containing protein [bacterium]|nr:hemerythrin domain-containing protein [bacterium]